MQCGPYILSRLGRWIEESILIDPYTRIWRYEPWEGGREGGMRWDEEG